MAIKLEVNIRRLIVQCECMVSEAQRKETLVDWRLSKFVAYLEKQLQALEKTDAPPCDDAMKEYKRKILFLKDIVKSESLNNPSDRTRLCQHLLPGSVVSSLYENSVMPSKTKELHLQVKGRHHRDLRKDLLDDHSQYGARKRIIPEPSDTKADIDDIIKHHHDMQEKVAEEMIRMAHNMKHNSLIAQDIIKRDNKELEAASKLTDANTSKLKVESQRLEELNKRKCSCGIWIMLVIVCIVFINMVIFIKFFPKRRH